MSESDDFLRCSSIILIPRRKTRVLACLTVATYTVFAHRLRMQVDVSSYRGQENLAWWVLVYRVLYRNEINSLVIVEDGKPIRKKNKL